jgi:lipopolysaccharide export system protein LptA
MSMKLILSNRMRITVFSILLALSSLVAATEVVVTADELDFQEGAGLSIYEGNARLTQGDSYLTAEVIRVDHADREFKKVSLTGGKRQQVHMYHTPEKGKTGVVEAWADKVRYNIPAGIVTLIGNAKITQGKNMIRAGKIVFDRNKNRIRASKIKKRRVTTVFDLGSHKKKKR